MIAKGNTKINVIYHGENKVQRIFKGTTKVYEFLPKEYQEVKCIITDGNCYIDSNYNFTQDTTINMPFMTPPNLPTNKTQCLFYAGYSAANTYGFAITSNSIAGKYRAFYGGTYNGTQLSTETKYNLKYEKNKFYLDNVLINTFTERTFTTPFTMPFFAQYYQSTSAINKCYAGTKIYYIKIYDGDDVLVRDMIPCYRKSDNEVGFFDRVNKVFYTNLGTGDFTYESL